MVKGVNWEGMIPKIIIVCHFHEGLIPGMKLQDAYFRSE